jgi:hypothetical protein
MDANISLEPELAQSPSTKLDGLIVRPIQTGERQAWDALVAQHHYLGMRAIVGEAMRYVAQIDAQWVALLGWGAAAFKNRHRDTWIGWNSGLQWERLRYVVNNVRFLVLPGVQVKNLASKVLSANLRRLSRDYEEAYGHPVLLVETFVDTSRFAGTCYRAAGWIELGKTRGFGRNGGKYYQHGHPKSIFIRPLRKDAQRILADVHPRPELTEKGYAMDVTTCRIEEPAGLIEHLRHVPDPRKRRGIRHQKVPVLATAICAMLSGANSFAAMAQWGKNCSQKMLARLGCRRNRTTLRYDPPSEPTIRRMLQGVDAEAVDREVGAWLYAEAHRKEKEQIPVDGKTLRGSGGKGGSDKKQAHLLSAFLQREGVVIAQRAVGEKSNEIPALRPLLAGIDISGAVVTADAMHTQTDSAKFIVQEKHADYLFVVKDNQATLKNDIEALRLEGIPPSSRDDG